MKLVASCITLIDISAISLHYWLRHFRWHYYWLISQLMIAIGFDALTLLIIIIITPAEERRLILSAAAFRYFVHTFAFQIFSFSSSFDISSLHIFFISFIISTLRFSSLRYHFIAELFFITLSFSNIFFIWFADASHHCFDCYAIEAYFAYYAMPLRWCHYAITLRHAIITPFQPFSFFLSPAASEAFAAFRRVSSFQLALSMLKAEALQLW